MERPDAFGLLEKKVKKLVGTRFRKPTPIQQEVIPEILQARAMAILAPLSANDSPINCMCRWRS